MPDFANPIARDTDMALLHPAFRDALGKTLAKLAAEKIPLLVFEAYRTPARQAHLFGQGRTRPGNIVTYAEPWSSYHQYGLASDLVFKVNGNWTWEEPKKGMWTRFHEIAASFGLARLQFETPHVQIAGTSTSALREGRFPEGGDASWAENMAASIALWTGPQHAPAPPPIQDKPPVQ